MAFDVTSLLDIPVGDTVNAHPATAFAIVNLVIPVSSSANIKHAVRSSDEPVSDDWVCGMLSKFSWSLRVESAIPLTLEILTQSGATGAAFRHWRSFYIRVTDVWNTVTDLEVPAMNCRLTVHNSSGSVQPTLLGYVRMRAF